MSKNKSKKESKIENINFTQTEDGNYVIHADDDIFGQAYYRDPRELFSGDNYASFVEKCKKKIRTSQTYKAYVAYLHKLGLGRDAFQSNITDEVASIEMHHGPIFTLDDYVRIMIDYAYDNNMPVSTLTIAYLVMYEHRADNVQVIMLSVTNHQLAEAGELFIDFRQCWGNFSNFVEKYKKYIISSPKLRRKILNYHKAIEDKKFDNTSIIQFENITSYASVAKFEETKNANITYSPVSGFFN